METRNYEELNSPINSYLDDYKAERVLLSDEVETTKNAFAKEIKENFGKEMKEELSKIKTPEKKSKFKEFLDKLSRICN